MLGNVATCHIYVTPQTGSVPKPVLGPQTGNEFFSSPKPVLEGPEPVLEEGVDPPNRYSSRTGSGIFQNRFWTREVPSKPVLRQNRFWKSFQNRFWRVGSITGSGTCPEPVMDAQSGTDLLSTYSLLIVRSVPTRTVAWVTARVACALCLSARTTVSHTLAKAVAMHNALAAYRRH